MSDLSLNRYLPNSNSVFQDLTLINLRHMEMDICIFKSYNGLEFGNFKVIKKLT